MYMEPKKLKSYILLGYIFSFTSELFIIILFYTFGDYFFAYISPNDEIYLRCCEMKIILCIYIMLVNAYYFYMGCLKGY